MLGVVRATLIKSLLRRHVADQMRRSASNKTWRVPTPITPTLEPKAHISMKTDATTTDITRAGPRHRAASGNNLRVAVLGANDGLVSNFCLIMGVAAAGTENRVILLTGLAGLAAGACSMALGEWLSVTNARELAKTEIFREAEQLEQWPQSEERELALIY